MRRLRNRSSLALLGALALAATLAGQQPASVIETARFVVMFQGRAIGAEDVTVSATPGGWLIAATSDLGPPFSLVTSKFQLRYGNDWQPESLAIEGTRAGQLLTLASTFTRETALNQMMQGGQTSTSSHKVSARTIVLPNGFYAPYEALAAQLGSAAIGARFPVYVAPQAEMSVTVVRITPHRLLTPSGPRDLRQVELTLNNPAGPSVIEVWIDSRDRLARLAMPGGAVAVVREDLSSVMTHEETITRAGDQDVFVPALGFSLAGTLSKPAGAQGRRPAVILVGAAGPQDRDETAVGIPLFGQIAGGLADAGFVVMRYDKRGVGRSGGRMESATLADYADDVMSLFGWMRKRPEIDPDRIAVVGYAEGAAVAMLAGSREKHIAAVGLLAGPGQTGRELTLLQQQHALTRTNESDAAKKVKTDLEVRLIDAAVKGTGWEGIPPELRRQADTPWFRSWLVFDPAVVMNKIRQPVLMVHGSLDTQMPPAQGDQLEVLSRARKKVPESYTRKLVVPGANHLLLPARTGETDEYASLGGQSVAPAVVSALAAWLTDVLPPKK
jgi:fermentation-respiration switch protein FrsA (DUF1100 family)